jgi:hypothetical protein
MPTSTASSGLTRRQLFPVLGAAGLAAVVPRTLAAAPRQDPGKPPTVEARFVYVGTYTAPGVRPGGTHPSTAVGIYVFRMDLRDGDLIPVQVVTTDNPSFVALDPTLTHLYSSVHPSDGICSGPTTALATIPSTESGPTAPSARTVVAGTKAARRRHSRLSVRINRSTRL